MVTALDDVETVRQSREVGAAEYVTKPIAQEQLLQGLGRATSPETEERPAPAPSLELQSQHERIEAEYTLEFPVRCPVCGESIRSVKAVRLLRAHVNFTSRLPRRGRILACSHCLAMIPAELTNF